MRELSDLLEAPRRSHDNLRGVVCQQLLLRLQGQASEKVAHLDRRQVHAEALELVADLQINKHRLLLLHTSPCRQNAYLSVLWHMQCGS